MSYVLEDSAKAPLVQPLTQFPEVRVIEVEFRTDQYGEDALFFRVVLTDDFETLTAASDIGARLETIASVLRGRAANAGLPFSYVQFVTESEA